MAGPFLTDVSKSWNLDQAAHNPFSSLSLQRAGDPREIVGGALFLDRTHPASPPLDSAGRRRLFLISPQT